MYELYEQMIAAYKTGDDGQFIPAARRWFQKCAVNPFQEDTEAHEQYFQADRHFGYWTAGGINSRVSKQRFIEALRNIAKLDAANPHEKDEPEGKKPEPVHVLGVMPEEDMVREGGWKISSDAIVQAERLAQLKKEIKEELKEELKEEEQPKKGLFSRKKK